MTLAGLAALAATVEGFVRPTVECSGCDGSGGVFVWYGETRETAYGSRCEQCGNTGRVFDNSPAALAMAAIIAVAKASHRLIAGFDDNTVRVWQVEPAKLWDAHHNFTPEDIARALLVALLRAHGVEVPGD